jgi:predicted RNA binding protein YcfA (HicA-like mRNA interferase family)
VPKYSKQIKDQIKSITKLELIKALHKDGFVLYKDRGGSSGSVMPFYKETNDPKNPIVINIHFHHNQGRLIENILMGILDQTGWTEEDLIRLKLVKR